MSAAAVSAHECGHVVQHATAYSMSMLRSRLVPLTQISINLSQWIIIVGLGIMGFGGGNQTMLMIGISTLFSIITLSVEFGASSGIEWAECG